MNPTAKSILVLLMFLAESRAVNADDTSFRFLAIGDMPYSPEQEKQFRRLLKQSEGEDIAFLMHVGDFKSQSTMCSDEEFSKIRAAFSAYPKPVVYTPGDNEWTDCHGADADPVERLGKIREWFFNDSKTLRLQGLNTLHQSRDPHFADFVENYRFSKSDVMFIVVHVVGSGNNYRADVPAAMEEFNSRNAANLAFLAESFAEAVASDVRGVAVVIHANPGFENDNAPGFKDFLAVMRGFLSEFRQPVVCIHGDSHYYRIDKPLRSEDGTTYLDFTRMEVFGSPRIAGVMVSVDPADPQVFSFRPYYLGRDD